MNTEEKQLTLCDFGMWYDETDPESSETASQRGRSSTSPPKKAAELRAVPYMFLDLNGPGNLLGLLYWEILSPWRGGSFLLNTGVSPSVTKTSTLSQILEDKPAPKYYLSKTACLGILRRAKERGKELPLQLKTALSAQAGLASASVPQSELKAYHINQRDEGIDLGEVSGALMATVNGVPAQAQQSGLRGVRRSSEMSELSPQGGSEGYGACDDAQMQTFVTGEPIAFAANQRDEVRDLHDVAGAIQAQPGMKQQPFIADGCLTPWDTQQKRISLPDGVAPTLSGADGGGGRNPGGLLFAAGVVSKGDGDCFLMPERHTSLCMGGGQAGQDYPCVLTAAFSAGQGAKAGGIGYQEECAPTLKAGESGTNMVPSILCLNDQGGAVMEVSEDVSGTLRAQEHGHQPLVFENHGIDSRYTGSHLTVPTLSARAGTGSNNLPLVADADAPPLCIAGNIIDRQPQNGGNGLGCQEDIAYTLTATDRHAVFSRQRVDVFKDDEVVSTQSARQHKDATDLIYQESVGALTSSDRKGPNSQYVGQDKLVVETPLLIRRLTPLECERLQGFPDGWTELPSASDSARYKALGNSVAIPCVEYVMCGIALAMAAAKAGV